MRQFTVELPSDLIFEDQVGARAPQLDFRPYGLTPSFNQTGWLAHTRRYASHLLMTEGGYDLLAGTNVGFHSSILLSRKLGATDVWWGDDNWETIPFALAINRDKVFFYQHNLAPETMSNDLEMVTWNLVMGFMLSYDLFESSHGGGMDSEWLDYLGAVQKHIAAPYASQLVTDYWHDSALSHPNPIWSI